MKVGRNNIDKKVFSLKDFRGVDYASSPLEVKPYRATDMANLLLRDGQLQKRYGFKQLHQENDFYGFTFNERISGVNAYKCGKNLIVTYQDVTEGYRTFVRTYTKEDGVFKMINEMHVASLLSLATGVYGGEYFYLFWKHGIKRTEDGKEWEDVVSYVPTTTINIPVTTYDSAEDTMATDSEVYYAYQSNESINMLTKRRKNALSVKMNETTGVRHFYKLDGVAVFPSEAGAYPTIKPKAYVNGQEVGNFEAKQYSDTTGSSTDFYVDSICWVDESLGVTILKKRENLFNVGDITKYVDNASVVTVNTHKFANNIAALGVADNSEHVTLTLEFEADIPDESDTIYSATTAVNFGVGGADDRIFAANGNKVYFSENTAKLQADASYFPVDQWVECGYSNSPITAMMRVSDGTLAIFKDVSAYEDVAVYYTSGFYESVGVGEEGNEYQRARFTVKSGDIRRTGISAKAVANLEGDNIFTSKEGVYGIQLSSNVASGERYARERSRTINPKITQFDLQNARGIVYKDKYFLAVGNGEVYVADARYTFTQKGDQQDTFNYEWFRLTGLNVLEWFIFDDKLHFIDKDGYICEFTDGFADQYLVSSKDNELTAHREDELWVEGGKVTFNSDRLPLIKASSYAIDHLGRTWQLELVDNDTALKIPEGITIADSADLDLWFCVPIAAYWQSAVMDLGTPIYLKNMWSLSMVASAKHGGKINLGYKTRMNAVSNIEVEGANEADFGKMIDNLFGGTQTSLLTGGVNSFGMYTFDVGGYVGINTYRRRLFDRNFAHIQLLFTSETTTDCAVAEMDIEYSISRKNIGVG